MWKLVIVDDQHQKTVVNLVRDEYTIGRAAGHAIRLTEQNVSRKHARITRTANGFQIEDLSSYNGSSINGLKLEGQQDLGHNDVIQIGDYRVQVVDETIDTQEQGYRPFEGATEPAITGQLPHRLVELIGPRQGDEYPLVGDRFLVGRGEECDIVLEHGSVSRVHAEIRRIGDDRFEVIDKGSANGLRINGHELSRALLDGRDVIEIGDVVLKYISQGQIFRASVDEGLRIAAFAGTGAPPPNSTQKPAATSIVAAIVGALVVALGLLFLVQHRKTNPEHVTPKELITLENMISQGDLIGASEKLQNLGTLEKNLAGYDRLRVDWAQATLQAKNIDEENRRRLLTQIVKTPGMPAPLRNQAQSELAAVTEGAVDLSALDQSTENEK